MSCVNPHLCHHHQPRQRSAPDVVKCGGTAGITCLTLQPVLALVSMNMTFNSLALCSPSSIVICLHAKKKKKKHSRFTGAALTYMALTHLQCLIHNIWLWTVCHTVSLPGLFCSRLAWWWRHFLSLSWRRRSTLKSAGKSWHLWRADVLKAWRPCATMLLQHSDYSVTLTCDVIDHHSHRRVTYVARNEAPKTLLPSGVPELQPYLQRQTNWE